MAIFLRITQKTIIDFFSYPKDIEIENLSIIAT